MQTFYNGLPFKIKLNSKKKKKRKRERLLCEITKPCFKNMQKSVALKIASKKA